MAKAASPIRLEAELIEAAERVRDISHRSIAGQIEYWAAIGRTIGRSLTPEQLLSLQSGCVDVVVQTREVAPLDPQQIFAEVERRRTSGALAGQVTGSGIRYQASETYPGYLEQLGPDGEVAIGRFVGGQFKPEPALSRQAP